MTHTRHDFPLRGRSAAPAALLAALVLLAASVPAALAQDPAPAAATPGAAPKDAASAAAAPTAKDIGEQVRRALKTGDASAKKLTISVAGAAGTGGEAVNPKASRQYIRARAAALAGHGAPAEEAEHGTGEVHWSYEGDNGPQAWGRLTPEFSTCATGKRQSPINIDESSTLRGPAEAIGFDYRASSATVVNNGHTIQIDVTGDNGILIRGSRFQLLQLHFHHPSEERVNYRSFAMVAHLVHKDHLGRLAVVAVLLEPGAANPAIDNFWTYMPLDVGDRVPMPTGSVDLAGLLPKDQRYYQFMGSLTTPPCTEGVLWMVLKQPVTISRAQLRLFGQQFPNNARPVQATNGRVVRDAQ